MGAALALAGCGRPSPRTSPLLPPALDAGGGSSERVDAGNGTPDDAGPVDTLGRGDAGFPICASPGDAGAASAFDGGTIEPFDAGPAGCIDVPGALDRILLQGTVVTPGSVFPGGQVLVNAATGLIDCVGQDCSAQATDAGASQVCTRGLIYPGLVDAHDHLAYDFMPPWRHGILFDHRYQWRNAAGYDAFLAPYRALGGSSGAYACQVARYAEAREVAGGATSVEGSPSLACVEGLARNLDRGSTTPGSDHSGLGVPRLDTSIDVGTVSPARASGILADLASGTPAYVPHVGEGVDELVSRTDFHQLFSLDLATPRTSVIHATGARLEELERLRAGGARIIWSPRSNLDLYGTTTRVTLAHALGIPIALGPDWTPSGSFNVLEELTCADQLNRTALGQTFTDQELVEMATTRAAEAMGVGDQIGQLAPGFRADVLVLAGDPAQPYRALLAAGAAQVRLVLVGGKPVYGDAALMAHLARGNAYCEPWTMCGLAKTFCAKSTSNASDYTVADAQGQLASHLAQLRTQDPAYDPSDPDATYNYALLDLARCGAPPPCAFAGPGPAPGDEDGDGIPDGVDDCPTVYDPDQADADLDGLGDACDPCPRAPGTSQCSGGDLDDDGAPNASDACPLIAGGSAAQCAPCSTASGCVATLASIRDPGAPDRPKLKSEIVLDGLVVTGVRPASASSNGVYLEDASGPEPRGIHVFLKSAATAVQRGDRVDVSGLLNDYQGELEIAAAGTDGGAPLTLTPRPDLPAGEPAPMEVDPAEIATRGARAAQLQGVVVRVRKVRVDVPNPDAPSDFGNWQITGGLRVGDVLSPGLVRPSACTAIESITGVLAYDHDQATILPRSPDEVVLAR